MILYLSILLFVSSVWFIIDVTLTIRRRKRLKELLKEAVNTDGDHHKQWYLHKIAEELALKINQDDKGIAP